MIGQEQVLLILAVPIDNKSYITPLSMQDVRVVSVEVKSSWKSEAIASLIRSTMAKEGIEVRYVISDNGTALGAAYKLCGLPKIADCTHQMANILQKLYSKDTQLSGFVKQMNATRAKWVKSRYIVYLPPTLRAKSRFHQLFTISQWAQLMLVKWSKMPIIVQEELIYLKENEVFIAQMCIINQLVKDLGLILKSEGIHLKTTLKCENLFREIEIKTDEERIRKFIAQMRDYIKEPQKQLPNMTQILCCSDIIESMFGKYKNKKNTHEMLTEDVLTIAAFGGNMSCEDVKAACANTKIKDVQKWKKEKTIPSVITLKKQFKAA